MLARLLRSAIRHQSFALVDADGHRHPIGPGEPRLTIRLHDRALHRDLVLNPRLRFGEGYMDGTITIEGGTIYDALALLNDSAEVQGFIGRLGARAAPILRHAQQLNPLGRSAQNVAHHYDLSRRLYELFLDEDMQYSCAYFAHPDMSLEAAQEAKKRHIAAKLLLKPGQRVLDIGCGWGGMALFLARSTGVEVTGITLSKEQLDVARERAAQAGLSERVRFDLCDYRAMSGRFDRIVSVGMFEHVGVPQYRRFFDKVHELLEPDGVALLHSIGRSEGPGHTAAWIRKYIFPGGYSPALSEVLPVVGQSGLWATDVEVLRLHYAKTLRHWRERFVANWDEAAAMYDERFCRMWEFYLAAAEMAFRYQGHMVFQIQLARSPAAVPLTRDYMVGAERALAAGDTDAQAPFSARSL